MAAARTLPLFAAGLILYGASEFSISAMNRYITSVRGNFTVGRSLTLSSGLYNLGAVLGPVSGGFLAKKFGFQTIYLVAVVVFVISTILIFSIEKNPPAHHDDTGSVTSRGMTRNSTFLLFSVIVFLMIISAYLAQPLTPNFLQNQRGYDASMIGILGSIGNLGNALTMLVLGSLPPMMGMIVGQVMVGGFSAFFLLGNSPVLFGLGYFLFGGFRLGKSLVLAFARPLVHPEETGLTFGILETVSAFAIILAPVISGLLYDQSPKLMYEVSLAAIAFSVAVSIYALPRIQKKLLRVPSSEIVEVEND
jgi:MFS family permease